MQPGFGSAPVMLPRIGRPAKLSLVTHPRPA